MQKSAQPDARAVALCLAGIAAITLWRLALLPFSTAELFVDEAQYWFWGQTLDWGYYSKPPLIAWILRAATDLGGNSPFWIHAPLALIHAGTALLLLATGRRLFGDRVGALAGLAFATLPAVSLACLLVSTDTPMLFFFALALYAFVRLGQRASAGWALAMGVAVGLGLLAKYAMIYFPASALIAALFVRQARIGRRDAGIAVVAGLVTVSPNIFWNLSHDLTTLHHTADNADWHGVRLEFGKLLEFWGGQFAVSGPVLFGAFLVGLGGIGRDWRIRLLALMALPALAIVSVQAILSGANANWAAAGHLGAVLIGITVLAARPRWVTASFAINAFLALALPVAVIFADSWRMGGNLVMARYIGMGAISTRAEAIAKREGLGVLVSPSRVLLADEFWTLRDSGLEIYAPPPEGFPDSHYAQTHPLPPGPGEVLYVSRKARPPKGCPDARPIETWEATEGFFVGEIGAFRVPRSCWFPDAG